MAQYLIRLLPLLSQISTLPIPSSHYNRVIYPRAVTSLDQAATAEAQQRDDSAVRAFSGVPIVTASGKCLTVDPLGGDFRANLIPILEQDCDGSPGQEWDVITSGKHNNREGFALYVSTLVQGCINFDDRRADGDKVNLFSCGGRADGGGDVTDSQLFPFTSGQTSVNLLPANGQGTTCLEVINGRLDAGVCDQDCQQGFTIDGEPDETTDPANDATTTTTSTEEATSTSSTAASATVTSVPPTNDVPTANPTTEVPVSRAGGVLQPSAAAESNQRDDTATRAIAAGEIKTPNGKCLFVDPTAGDFRQNLIPVQEADCDGSLNTKWDFITAGKHNSRSADGVSLIVSSITGGCLNFDDRRAEGDRVLLFSCGGRADGEGETTDSQLFPFTAGTTSLALAPANARGATCFTIKDGLLQDAACDNAADQLFTVGGGDASAPAATTTSEVATSTASATSTSVETSSAVETSTSVSDSVTSAAGAIPTANPTTEVPVSRAGGVLQPSAAAESNQRDDTATRAVTGGEIRTPNGKCLFVDPTAGDFRQNLIPVQEADCDGSLNTKWDFITSGEHNSRSADGVSLIVSSITGGCLNFDDRRAEGDRVLLFSCGGRADGEGETTDSQLFPFTAGTTSLALAPANARGATCFTIKDGLLQDAACDNAADQTFQVVA